jgi:hypothetical protein
VTFRFAVLGDSLAQGFLGGAVSDTLWSFPAILARSLGLRVGTDARADFRVPGIPGDGLPINLASGLNTVFRATGEPIGFLEWPAVALPSLLKYLRRTERFYERGTGAKPLPFNGVFHNLGMYGLKTRESHELTADRCNAIVREQEERFHLFPFPSAHRQRAARMVLNPAGTADRGNFTQLGNLDLLVRGSRALGIEPEPLDALIVWLGSNDCLQTVVQVELRDMPATGEAADPNGQPYNLTSKEHFERDFEEVARQISATLEGRRTRVYVGNVPDITIPPIAKGLGHWDPGEGLFEHYGRFFFGDRVPWLGKALSRDEARLIQQRIKGYNDYIERVCNQRGWTLVDTAGVLSLLAVRRNAPADVACQDVRSARRDPELRASLSEVAEAQFKKYCERIGVKHHALQNLKPLPSVLMLDSDASGNRIQGGLVSLDGVHPSTIGYGIAAEGFLNKMQADFPALGHARVPWREVIAADALLPTPPRIWDDVRSLLASLPVPFDWLFRILPFGG